MMTLYDEIKKELVESIAVTFWAMKDGDAHDLKDACDVAHTSMKAAMIYIQHLEAERDAAIKDMSLYAMCAACKHAKDEHEEKCPYKDDCLYGTEGHFEWRGVQKEE